MEAFLMTVNLLLVFVTFLLVGVTFWYALSTRRIANQTAAAATAARQSAEAAARSATAAEQLAKLQRQQIILASVPRLVLSHQGNDQRGAAFALSNRGKGVARGIKCYARRKREGGEELVGVRALHELGERKEHFVTLRMANPGDWAELAMICHYTDLHATEEEPRIYHSVFVDCRDGKRPSGEDYFPPERPIAENPDWASDLGICQACQGEAG
jgi:hypothetical protein